MSKLSEKHPMLVTFEDIQKEDRWGTCLDKLRKEYQTSFRTVCQVLKCSRTWVSTYIKPHCHYIYLSPIQGYSRIAAETLDRDSTESVWFKTSEFEDLIRSSIRSCSRQTIKIPVEYLIDPQKMNSFRTEYKRIDVLMDICKNHKDFSEIDRLIDRKNVLLMESASFVGKKVLDNRPVKHRRSDSPSVECELPKFELVQLQATHDLKTYGDTDELIYRDLFLKGSYRIEICIPDQHGVVSKKIFYLFGDEVDQTDFTGSIGQILIKYDDFMKYKNDFTTLKMGSATPKMG